MLLVSQRKAFHNTIQNVSIKGNGDILWPKNKKKLPSQLQSTSQKRSAATLNFCRVTGSPEELIVDFGMNASPMGSNDKPVEIQQRIVLNFFTAKRLLHALHVSVQRHEEVFGNIETDIQKRVVPREGASS